MQAVLSTLRGIGWRSRGALFASLLLALPTLANASGIEAAQGRWGGAKLIAVTDADITDPGQVEITLGAEGDGFNATVMFGDVLRMDLGMERTQSGSPILVEETGWFGGMLGGNDSAAIRLVEGKRVAWARETENGVVLYAAEIADGGAIEIQRVTIVREAGAVTATAQVRAPGQPVRAIVAELEER